MEKYYLAVDIGASSGRHILGHLENGKIELEEIYRFENGMDHKDGKLLWDVNRLFGEIVAGMKKCKELGKIPVSMAIDTWAVDYVLLDEKDQILGDTYGYRDHRTDGMDAEVAKILPETELYARTGIQKQIFNTIYQLMAVEKKTPEIMKQAKTLLMQAGLPGGYFPAAADARNESGPAASGDSEGSRIRSGSGTVRKP